MEPTSASPNVLWQCSRAISFCSHPLLAVSQRRGSHGSARRAARAERSSARSGRKPSAWSVIGFSLWGFSVRWDTTVNVTLEEESFSFPSFCLHAMLAILISALSNSRRKIWFYLTLSFSLTQFLKVAPNFLSNSHRCRCLLVERSPCDKAAGNQHTKTKALLGFPLKTSLCFSLTFTEPGHYKPR